MGGPKQTRFRFFSRRFVPDNGDPTRIERVARRAAERRQRSFADVQLSLGSASFAAVNGASFSAPNESEICIFNIHLAIS